MKLKHLSFDFREQVAKLVRSHHPHFETSKLLNSIVMQCDRGKQNRCTYHTFVLTIRNVGVKPASCHAGKNYKASNYFVTFSRAHLWHTAHNEAIAIGVRGRPTTSVPAQFQFELLNKPSKSVVLHNCVLDLPCQDVRLGGIKASTLPPL